MRKFLCIVLIFSGLSLSAQQDPQFTMNFANKLFNNPAYAGTKNICATGIFRQQWAGLEGAPRDIVFSMHTPIKFRFAEDMNLFNPGVGITFLNDVIGPISSWQLKAALSNQFRFTNFGTLGFGITVGALGVNLDPTNLGTPDGRFGGDIIDPNINPNNNAQQAGFDMDIGLYYRTLDEKTWAGISLTHLVPSEITSIVQEGAGGLPEQRTRFAIASHMYIMGGTRLSLTSDWELLPEAYVKTDLKTTQVDLTARALYQNRIWGGISYRYQDAVAVMGGYNWDNIGTGILKAGFSYDVNTSKLSKHNVGSFEIFVNYCFGIQPKLKTSIHKNPLWL